MKRRNIKGAGGVDANLNAELSKILKEFPLQWAKWAKIELQDVFDLSEGPFICQLSMVEYVNEFLLRHKERLQEVYSKSKRQHKSLTAGS